MAGTAILRIFLTNTGGAPCRLDGEPLLLPLDVHGVVPQHMFDANLDGDFGGPVGATLLPASADAAYIPVSITGREDLNPCTGPFITIRAWRLRFPSWSHSVDVPAVGDIRACEGRFRSGGVMSNPMRK